MAGAAFAQTTDTIRMPVDEVRVLTFSQPVKTAYVGNPTIADITVIDSRHVFLQGKSSGTTNVLALDNAGKQIANERVAVYNQQDNIVTLQRGAGRTTLSCAGGSCEIRPTPGDEAAPFDAISGQVQKHEQSLKAAAAGQ
jgi:hypothetical protein